MALPPPANNGVAPICNAKPAPAVFKTIVPSQALTPVTADTMLPAIQQLQTAVAALTKKVPVNNTINALPVAAADTGGGSSDGLLGGLKKPKKNPDDPQWEETQRNTQNVKVVNPDDDSQFVIVKEITFLEFTNSVTGETITLRRDPLGGNT